MRSFIPFAIFGSMTLALIAYCDRLHTDVQKLKDEKWACQLKATILDEQLIDAHIEIRTLKNKR